MVNCNRNYYMKKSEIIAFILSFLSISAFSQWHYQNPKPTGEPFNSIHFIDTLNGWAVGFFSLLHSIDGGVTWEFQTPGQFYSRPSSSPLIRMVCENLINIESIKNKIK
jgi:hypothetical protein